MPNDRLWDAVATIEVDGKLGDPLRLSQQGSVTIGRSARAGLRSPSPLIKVPRELAQLRCTKSGWMLQNSGTTVGSDPKPVRITGPDIQSPSGALFAPHAWVLLSRGSWTLKWDVGITVTVTLEPLSLIGPPPALAVDQPRSAAGYLTVVPEQVRLTPLEHKNMAALFAYLIRGDPEPRHSFAEAARLLGGDEATRGKNRALIKSQLQKVTQRINRIRAKDDALITQEEVGLYLVNLTGTVSRDDLED